MKSQGVILCRPQLAWLGLLLVALFTSGCANDESSDGIGTADGACLVKLDGRVTANLDCSVYTEGSRDSLSQLEANKDELGRTVFAKIWCGWSAPASGQFDQDTLFDESGAYFHCSVETDDGRQWLNSEPSDGFSLSLISREPIPMMTGGKYSRPHGHLSSDLTSSSSVSRVHIEADF